jgi:hypothetical protein
MKQRVHYCMKRPPLDALDVNFCMVVDHTHAHNSVRNTVVYTLIITNMALVRTFESDIFNPVADTQV